MEKECIKIGDNVIRFDSITEVYICDIDGETLYIFTEDSMFDFSATEYDTKTMFNTIIEYLHIVEKF